MPLIWLTIVTMSAGWEKLFSPEAKLGFLAHAKVIEGQVASGALPAAIKTVADARRMIFNDYLDAAVAAFFMVSVVVILAASLARVGGVPARHEAGDLVGSTFRGRFRPQRLMDFARTGRQ
jgi:carbon starvation protein